jgi:hypothetical protein
MPDGRREHLAAARSHALSAHPRLGSADKDGQQEMSMRRRLVVLFTLTLVAACGEDEPASPPAAEQSLLPTEAPPSNRIPEPIRHPIPHEGIDPSKLVAEPLTPKQQADIDDANRLAAARAREMDDVVIVPPPAVAKKGGGR